MEKQYDIEDEIEIDLLELARVYLSKKVAILMTGIITAAVFGLVTMFLMTPNYESTSKLYIMSQSSSVSALAANLQVGTQLTQDYMVVIKSRPVLEKVMKNLRLDMDYNGFSNMISLQNITNTRVLMITVTSKDPYLSKEIVDEVSKVSTERIKDIMDVDPPTTIEYGHLEQCPVSPNLKKHIMIGGLLGIIVSMGIVTLSYLLNDTIATEQDIEKYLGLNMLGAIPIEEGEYEQMLLDKKKRKLQGNTILSKLRRKWSML